MLKVFPAVDVGDSIYKTLLLNKTGDTPIHYRIPDDPNKYVIIYPIVFYVLFLMFVLETISINYS